GGRSLGRRRVRVGMGHESVYHAISAPGFAKAGMPTRPGRNRTTHHRRRGAPVTTPPHPHPPGRALTATLLVALATAASTRAEEGDFIVRDFHFQSGETLPELRLHYLTLGAARRDAQGRVSNGVLVLHGTGGSGRQFLARSFGDPLYGPGAPLDTT